MGVKSPPRVRRSIYELQDNYHSGNKAPLENLVRAWKGIEELPPTDSRSFFCLAGLHGEPFRGAGWGNASFWGGYCNHGNILFPTWHRAYLVKLEEALRSVPGCKDVTLPFWDECSEEAVKNGVPWALTQKDFELDGKTIPNPLRSFVLPVQIKDFLATFPDADYSKPANYETKRYPLSGLVGSEANQKVTELHNAQYPDHNTNTKLLNDNVVEWLGSQIIVNGKPMPTNVLAKYLNCLDAPNYTVFSNTTSVQQWNEERGSMVTSLESPHNSIHLAVGGIDIPTQNDDAIEGANGDMGENDTASFDPIFFFHHCFVDYVFWIWQKRHDKTFKLDIIPEYPGTNSVDSLGATPGTAPNSWLTLDSPLDPFKLTEDGKERPYKSTDCVHIEDQLGYTYGPGSLDAAAEPTFTVAAASAEPTSFIRVRGINRASIRGSFVVAAFATLDGKRTLIGHEAILSRWHVQGCANCQTHLEVKAHMPIHGFAPEDMGAANIEVELRTRRQLSVPVAGNLVAMMAKRTKSIPFEMVGIKRDDSTINTFPAVGHRYFVDFKAFRVQLYFESLISLTYTGVKPDGSLGQSETVAIHVERIGRDLFLVSWQEMDKTTVVHIEDYKHQTIITNITNPDLTFNQYHGTFEKIG